MYRGVGRRGRGEEEGRKGQGEGAGRSRRVMNIKDKYQSTESATCSGYQQADPPLLVSLYILIVHA